MEYAHVLPTQAQLMEFVDVIKAFLAKMVIVLLQVYVHLMPSKFQELSNVFVLKENISLMDNVLLADQTKDGILIRKNVSA